MNTGPDLPGAGFAEKVGWLKNLCPEVWWFWRWLSRAGCGRLDPKVHCRVMVKDVIRLRSHAQVQMLVGLEPVQGYDCSDDVDGTGIC